MDEKTRLIIDLASALWRYRSHELNYDGSPCWCRTDLEPETHDEDCKRARGLYLQAMMVGAGIT